VGPAGLPPDVVKRLNEAFNTVMAMPAVRDKLAGGGLEVVGGSPEQFASHIQHEIDKWARVIRAASIKTE
jgi:tripartite-type tricarboxylate transporter receptor subunit TctC